MPRTLTLRVCVLQTPKIRCSDTPLTHLHRIPHLRSPKSTYSTRMLTRPAGIPSCIFIAAFLPATYDPSDLTPPPPALPAPAPFALATWAALAFIADMAMVVGSRFISGCGLPSRAEMASDDRRSVTGGNHSSPSSSLSFGQPLLLLVLLLLLKWVMLLFCVLAVLPVLPLALPWLPLCTLAEPTPGLPLFGNDA